MALTPPPPKTNTCTYTHAKTGHTLTSTSSYYRIKLQMLIVQMLIKMFVLLWTTEEEDLKGGLP